MAQIIIYTNLNGNVSVCVPSGEIPIEEVLTKDCPAGAIIVDDSILPKGADAQFFDAWVLNGTTISINIAKAQADRLAQFNAAAVQVAQKRQLNTLAGIANTPDDATFIAELTNGRAAIAAATTTTELLAITDPA